MGYRSIHVNGKDYDFIIGNDFVKVKGPEGEGSKVAKKHEVLELPEAEVREAYAQRCECCYGHNIDPVYGVTPARVAAWIRRAFPLTDPKARPTI